MSSPNTATNLRPPHMDVSPVPTDDDETDSNKDNDEEDLDDSTDGLIVLNVGGTRHETRIQTLKKNSRKPSRLLDIAEESERSGKKEFYFDRLPDFFPYILNFYRTGKLHLPSDTCGPLIKEELNFWQIDDKDIEQCCWVHYIKYEETLEMIEMFERDDKHHRLATKRISKDASWFQKKRPKLWRFLQDAYSSRGAMCYAFISLAMVILSITVFMIETLPYFKSIYVHSRRDRKNVTSNDLRKEIDIFGTFTPLSVLLIIDHSCNVFFLTELIVKLIAAPYKRKFLILPQTIVEFVCLIPYYIAVIIVFYHPDPLEIFDLIRLLISLRVLRIFRIFVLMKHFLALKILFYTIRASTKELSLLLLVVLIGVVIFACFVYYMEMFSDQETNFTHIPMACWWALVTMTTVGYGDMVPSTGQGYAAGAVCALCGVLVIALSVPAIVQNFTLYYTHAQSRLKLKQRKRNYRRKKWTNLKSLISQNGDPSKNTFSKIVDLARAESKKRRKSAAVAPMIHTSQESETTKKERPRSHSVAVGFAKGEVTNIFKKLHKTPNGVNTKPSSPKPSASKANPSKEDTGNQNQTSGNLTLQEKTDIPSTSTDLRNEGNEKPLYDNLPKIHVESEESPRSQLSAVAEETAEETTGNRLEESPKPPSIKSSLASKRPKKRNINGKGKVTFDVRSASEDSCGSEDMYDSEEKSEPEEEEEESKLKAREIWARLRKKSI